jgi:excinuclease UvrABC nuclease subunit
MGRCPAPCENTAASRQLYAQAVDDVRRFLTGADRSAADRVREAMQQAAGRLAFEEAGYYRDQLRLLERLMGRQRQIAAAVHDHHAVLVEPGLRENDVQLFFIRHGRLVETWDLPAPPTKQARLDLQERLEKHFDPALPVPERFMKHEVDEALILTRWMRHHPERSRQIRWSDGDDPAGLLDAVLDAARAEPESVAA